MFFDDILDRFIEKIGDCSIFSFPNRFEIIKSRLLDPKVRLYFHLMYTLSQ